MYCLCSNKSFDEIFELQEKNPVSAEDMIASYTNCLDGYLEHADTALVAGKNSRSRTSGRFTFLQIGTNYHNEHHMYPAIPCWRLPKVHKILKAQGFYKTNNIPDESSFFPGFRFTRARYTYTKGFDI